MRYYYEGTGGLTGRSEKTIIFLKIEKNARLLLVEEFIKRVKEQNEGFFWTVIREAIKNLED